MSNNFRGWSIPRLRELEKRGMTVIQTTPKKKKKGMPVIPQSEPPQISWMRLNLQYLCNDLALTLEEEYMFHVERKWRFDFAVPAIKFAAEYEGIFAAKSGHTTIDGFLKDVEKYNAAANLGWTVRRYTVKNYKGVLQDLREHVRNHTLSNQKLP